VTERENAKTEVKKSNEKESKYKKEQLIKSKRFSDKTDILNTVLSDDKRYTIK